jgi:hypothetical protein
MKVGDLVVKDDGHLDKGSIGLILEYPEANPAGNIILKILKSDGIMVLWSADLVRLINEE